MTRVAVTGIGVISAIGNNATENRQSLSSQAGGISNAKHFNSKYSSAFPFGEVKQSTEALLAKLNYATNSEWTRTCGFALTAAQEAISQANLSAEDLSSFDTALISASTVGGMCLTDQFYRDANFISDTNKYLGSYGCWAHTLRLIEAFNIKGFTNTINTACSSSANSIMMGARLIKAGKAKRAIVGGSDAIAKFTVNGFNALRILSDQVCQPFDQNRKGLNLGEGAAYLVLEDEKLVGDKPILAYIDGYGNANDAFHASRISDEAVGPTKAMEEAISSAGVDSAAINYINAHGTGTENNDLSELHAFHQIFSEVPPFSSTKSYTGHTLAAAGSIEAVFSILSLQNQEIYPNLNFSESFEPYNHPPQISYKDNLEVNYVLSNSFGFGGNCSSILIGKS